MTFLVFQQIFTNFITRLRKWWEGKENPVLEELLMQVKSGNQSATYLFPNGFPEDFAHVELIMLNSFLQISSAFYSLLESRGWFSSSVQSQSCQYSHRSTSLNVQWGDSQMSGNLKPPWFQCSDLNTHLSPILQSMGLQRLTIITSAEISWAIWHSPGVVLDHLLSALPNGHMWQVALGWAKQPTSWT